MRRRKSEPPLHQRPAFKRLRRRLKDPKPRALGWYYQVGKDVESLCRSENRGYGQGLVQTLAKKLVGRKSISTETLLWNTRNFVREFDEETVKQLVGLARNPNRLTWWHVRLLGTLHGDLKRKRIELARKYAENRWSVERLRQEVTALRGAKRNARGRKLRKPATLSEGLLQLNSDCRRWIKRYQAWFGDTGSVKQLPVGRGAKGTVTDLDQAIDWLAELSEFSSKAGQQLEPIRARLKGRASSTKPRKIKGRKRGRRKG